MRTAITTAKRHSGEEVLVSGRQEPMAKQWAAFRALRGGQSHKEFAELYYQESDGQLLVLRFRTLDKQKEHDAARAKEMAAANAAGEKEVKAQKERQAALNKKRDGEHADYIKEHDEKVMSDPNRTGPGVPARGPKPAPKQAPKAAAEQPAPAAEAPKAEAAEDTAKPEKAEAKE
jgi:hypothetical protein